MTKFEQNFTVLKPFKRHCKDDWVCAIRLRVVLPSFLPGTSSILRSVRLWSSTAEWSLVSLESVMSTPWQPATTTCSRASSCQRHLSKSRLLLNLPLLPGRLLRDLLATPFMCMKVIQGQILNTGDSSLLLICSAYEARSCFEWNRQNLSFRG